MTTNSNLTGDSRGVQRPYISSIHVWGFTFGRTLLKGSSSKISVLSIIYHVLYNTCLVVRVMYKSVQRGENETRATDVGTKEGFLEAVGIE